MSQNVGISNFSFKKIIFVPLIILFLFIGCFNVDVTHPILLPGPVFLETKSGKPLLQMLGYRYNLIKSYGLRSHWACNRAYLGCKCTVVTLDNTIVKIRHPHICPPKY